MEQGRRLIDLSVPIHNRVGHRNPRIEYLSHEDTAGQRGEAYGFDPAILPLPGMHFAGERITAYVHGSGTHVDAPWHYGPHVGSDPAPPVDELPLEWFYGPGVTLDCSRQPVHEPIEPGEIDQALDGFLLSAGDIVLIRTAESDADPWDLAAHRSLTRSAAEFLIDSGVRVLGVDSPSPDRPGYTELAAGNAEAYFPVHTLGRSHELCIVELLTNLHLLPHHGFEVSLFPIRIAGGSGAWCRAVAFLPPEPDQRSP